VSLYAVEIDLKNANTSHTQVVDLVGSDKSVLDVGCWTGELGRVLMTRGCRVSGVEIDPEAATIASEHLDQVVVADLDATPLSAHFEPECFDVIVFADVLEHLVDPVGVLADASRLLAPGGRVVISIPNVTHGSLRLALLQGRWNLTDTGLLDRTHIKFFSRSGLISLLRDAGMVVEDLRGTVADPLHVEVEIDDSTLPAHVVEWVRNQPDALVYQFQVAARPLQEGEPTTSVPPLVPAAEVRRVRRKDRHTAALVESPRDALVMRDHVIGLQAEATSARNRTARLQERLERKEKQLKELRRQVRRLEGELATSKRGWTRIPRALVRRVRARLHWH
jgi:2-polyprenyl-3-methyl-5-hydroxy-6-metoxy-1,4-benzoquinol methylase